MNAVENRNAFQLVPEPWYHRDGVVKQNAAHAWKSRAAVVESKTENVVKARDGWLAGAKAPIRGCVKLLLNAVGEMKSLMFVVNRFSRQVYMYTMCPVQSVRLSEVAWWL
jgi:hypothetical protein